MAGSCKVEVGARVLYDGHVCTVAALEGPIVRLRLPEGKAALVAMRELVGAPDFEIIDQVTGEDGWSAAAFDDLPTEVKREALELAANLNEALTGYRSGTPDVREPSEPKSRYIPDLTTVTERLESKREELGISHATIYKHKKRYLSQGVMGLVDRRRIRQHSPLGRLDPRVSQAILSVLRDISEESNVTRIRVFRLAQARLNEEHGPGVVQMPSDSALYRATKALTSGRGTFGSAKARRSIANRPETPYRRLLASRPGEVVLIDSTPLDVFALDDQGEWISLELIIALDVYTRSILAWRFTPRGAKAVDAALLLRDVITPTRMRPAWSESARWPYHGVPETLLLNGPGEPGVAGVPVVRPETVAVDRDRIYLSAVFWDACRMLGVNIRPARPYEPTDKAQIERMFRTIRQTLLENLPGYKGPDIWSRGKNIEETAFYFVSEIEQIFAEWVVVCWQNMEHEALRIPGAPRAKMSPNQAYDLGLETAGFIRVPQSADFYYELLPIRPRTIQHYGVDIDNLIYDGAALNPYRGGTSPYTGSYRGTWPVRLDPRDLTRAYFQDPEDGTWHELPWVHQPSPLRPLSDTLLAHAKRLARSRLGRQPASVDVAEEFRKIMERVERERAQDAGERRAVAKAFVRRDQAALDRGAPPARYQSGDQPAELGVQKPDHETDADPLDVDPASIQPLPLLIDEEPKHRERADARPSP